MADTVFSLSSWNICFREATMNPLWALKTLIISIIGCSGMLLFLTGLTQIYIIETRPVDPIIVPWSNGMLYDMQRRELGGWWLRFHMVVDPSVNCLRTSVHLMYRDVPGKPREYYSLATSLNGASVPGQAQDFLNLYLLPIDFPSGDWNYVYRAEYQCPPLDLVHHIQATSPIVIHVPGIDEELKPE